MAEYTDVFEIPSHGGRRAGAGGPKGYSKKRAAETGATWVKVSVDDDPALLARWSDQVPVTLVDGRPHDFYRVSEARLRAALKS